MRLGKLEIYPVTDGRFRLDGGAMFGVVPKVLWEKCCPADEKNRIQLGLNCLLIRAQGKNILVDTGLGSKVDPKFQDRFAVERRPPLDDSLKKAGLAVEDVHMVIKDRKSTRLNSSHSQISYAVFCLKKKKKQNNTIKRVNKIMTTYDI